MAALLLVVVQRLPRVEVGPLFHGRWLQIAGGACLVLGVWIVATLVHELGHAVAGRLVGFRLLALYVGPLQVVRWCGPTRVARTPSLALFGGAVMCAPTEWRGAAAFRRAVMVYTAGGPIASLLTALGAVCAFAVLGARAPLVSFVIASGGALAFGQTVVTLLPARMGGGLATDGAQLLTYRRGDPAVLAAAALRLLTRTRRPAEIPPDLLEYADAAVPAELASHAAYVRAAAALECGTLATAAAELQEALDRGASVNAVWRRSLALDAALFEFVWREDVAAAGGWMISVGAPPRFDPYGAALARAAEHACAGDMAAARRALAEATRCAARGFPEMVLTRQATFERLARRVDGEEVAPTPLAFAPPAFAPPASTALRTRYARAG